jgi:hypothetical protein
MPSITKTRGKDKYLPRAIMIPNLGNGRKQTAEYGGSSCLKTFEMGVGFAEPITFNFPDADF